MKSTILFPPAYARGPLDTLVAAVSTMLLSACAQMPSGPSVAIMPAPNKPFEVFRQDDELCRGWAAHSIGIPGNNAAADAVLASTVTGAVIGALAGAALGGDHNAAGAGAAMGAMMGASQGSSQSAYAAVGAQRAYDIAYQQCMYAKGNVVPPHTYGGYYYAPVPSAYPPPPPPPSR